MAEQGGNGGSAKRMRTMLLVSCRAQLRTCSGNDERQYIARLEGKVVELKSHYRKVTGGNKR